MKVFVLFICLLNIPICFSQKGFKKIHKAEKLIQKNKLNRAMKLLCQADSMDYGFCGNAWMEARDAITFAKIDIYYKKKEYQKVINTLLNLENGFSNNYDMKDSIIILCAIALHGKEKVKQDIDSALLQIKTFEVKAFYRFTNLNVAFLDKAFVVNIDALRSDILNVNKTESEKLELVKSYIREKAFYKLLLN